jgi:hypothetical protein
MFIHKEMIMRRNRNELIRYEDNWKDIVKALVSYIKKQKEINHLVGKGVRDREGHVCYMADSKNNLSPKDIHEWEGMVVIVSVECIHGKVRLAVRVREVFHTRYQGVRHSWEPHYVWERKVDVEETDEEKLVYNKCWEKFSHDSYSVERELGTIGEVPLKLQAENIISI